MTITLAPAPRQSSAPAARARILPTQKNPITKNPITSKRPLSSFSASPTLSPVLSPTLASFRGSEAALSQSSDFHMHDGLVTLDTPLPPNFPPGESFAAAVSIHAVQTLFGQRPIHQLRSWFTPALYQSFARRVSLSAGLYQRDTPRKSMYVRRIKPSFIRARVAEVAVVLYDGERLRAVAIRIEVQHNHWKVTALEIA